MPCWELLISEAPDSRFLKMASTDDLISKIVEYHRPRDLRKRIEESLPPNCRPRAYLRSLIQQLPSDDADFDAESLRIAIHYMFLIFGPQEAMDKCCELRPLVDLLRWEKGEDYDYLTSDKRVVIKRALQAFSISTVSKPSRLLSPSEVVRRIGEIDQDLGRAVDAQRFDLLQAQGGAIHVWTLVENVLKLSMGYFGRHFASSLPDRLFKSFKNALRKGSLGNVAQAMQDLEVFFKKGESLSEAKARRRERDKILKTIADAGERAERRNEFEAEETRIQEANRQRAEQLRNDCLRDFGRRSPFMRVDLAQYQQIFALQRNPFAHRPIDQLLGAPQDWQRIRKCLQEAKRIVESLREARATPRVIVILGNGVDNYGNRMIWFVDRQEENLPEMPRQLEWMYVTSEMTFEPFRQVAMLAPEGDPGQMEPLVDPVIYPIQQIETFIEAS
jgi:hypothetical protein